MILDIAETVLMEFQVEKRRILYHYIHLLPFLVGNEWKEIPINALHNTKINRVGVVWKVSERCLEGVWGLLG